jgi:RNA polymerase sigma factor (TIGR02999 family)
MSADEPEAGGARDPAEITTLLGAAGRGDRGAYDRVFDLVYDELRRIASRQLGSFGGREATLATTALVHEAYLKLAGDRIWSGNDRAHFFALAARAMRQILLDHARRHGRQKRGARAPHLDVAELELAERRTDAQVEELLAIDQALGRLAAVDAELARLVEWRFFAGLTLEEIAGFTGVSERTLKRDWRAARAFLYRELHGPSPDEPDAPDAGG